MSTSTSASSSAGPSRPPTATEPSAQAAARRNLKKGQACIQCRRGKMKCDAAQPHCTNCVKAWQLLLEGPPEADVVVPDGPICSYDRVEDLIFVPELITDPYMRIKAIEAHLAQLRGKLQEARGETGHLKRPGTAQSSASSKRRRPTTGMTADNGPSPDSRSLLPSGSSSSEGNSPFTILPPVIIEPSGTPAHIGRSPNLAPSPPAGAPQLYPSPIPEVPSWELFENLLDLFLAHESHASRIFHIPSLQQSLERQCSVKHYATGPASSSDGLIHAICASASRFVDPTDRTIHLPQGFGASHARHARTLINQALAEHQETLYAEQDVQASPSMPHSRMTPEENMNTRKRKIRRIRDKKLFQDAIQPMLVLATYLHHEGKGTEVWADVGALSRLEVSLGMNQPNRDDGDSNGPGDLIREEEKKRAFWSTFVMDRLLSAGGWAHSMAEEDTVTNYIGCDPPLSAKAFRDMERVPPSSPPPQSAPQPDSYSLLIDAAVMLGRVNDFRVRSKLRYRTVTPFPSPGPAHKASMASIIAHDPSIRWEFQQLNAALGGGVGYWASNGATGLSRQNGSMPKKFKNMIGVADVVGGIDVGRPDEDKRAVPLDGDLFLAHMVHHATTIFLNFPVATFDPPDIFSSSNTFYPAPLPLGNSFSGNQAASQQQAWPSAYSGGQLPLGPPGPDPGSELPQSNSQFTAELSAAVQESCMVNSRSLCLTAARSIVNGLSLIRATMCDITMLHPFVATSWYIAGVVLLHEHQHCVDTGDILNKGMLTKDVQLLRLCLLKYGARSPIGTHHAQQLTTIQDEIALAASSRAARLQVPSNLMPGQTQDAPPQQYIPIFPFDSTTYDNLPKESDASFGGAPLPRMAP